MSPAYARTVLDLAAEVEAAEMGIKKEILAAAESGDCARVADLVRRWLDMPPTEVLADIKVDRCGGLEVAQGTHPGAGDGRPLS